MSTATEHQPDQDEEQFRGRVRAFLEAHAPRRAGGDDSDGPDGEAFSGLSEGEEQSEELAVKAARTYQAALYDASLAALTWPAEYGGQGRSARYQTIFNEVAADYSTPDSIYTIGFGMCIPTVMAHGTEAHKQRYVRPAARGEEIWCQLFSEPSAGSDVASLRSAAVRDGDEWVLNGQKVWTSGAHRAQFGIVLVRTDPSQPKHRGLSMFILDMASPGITIRPLRQMNGAANFNEVFFDQVRIPASNILGEPGEGWRVALTTLMNERVAIGAGRSGEKSSPLAPVAFHLELARSRGLIGDPVVRQDLVDLVIRNWVLQMVGLRIRATIAAGRVPGPEGSVAKLGGALLMRRAADVAARLAGPAAAAWLDAGNAGDAGDAGDSRDADNRHAGLPAQLVLSSPGAGIAGGTNEVMRNILGERVLGLPKEPQVDRDIPFRDLPVG
jgi:alkylation response protein AidB-like acyl-CoA dehydrogenase